MHTRKSQIQKLDLIRSRSGFFAIGRHNAKWVAPPFIVLKGPLEGLSPDRTAFGLTVSRKCAAKAVSRNRIKRRLRAAVADIFPETAEAGYGYVIIARPKAETMPYEDLIKNLRWSLSRLKDMSPDISQKHNKRAEDKAQR